MFPTLLPSTNSVNPNLTIYNTATIEHAMSVVIPWMIVGIILMIIYVLIQKKLTTEKINHIDYGH